VHPGCAQGQGQGQGQGQRSRDTRTFLDSWNALYSVIDGLVCIVVYCEFIVISVTYSLHVLTFTVIVTGSIDRLQK